ncbi:unnamed protein product [Orchesella dallaii]|uniref:Partial AB-hydrolase lipase domain-containing protein n=1 Tax=Orchesella dallaii TaxID=48710 RepID=A0ABP1RVK5_9HEXA
MKFDVIRVSVVVIACQLALAQRFPSLQFTKPIRVCKEHQPLQTNVSTDPFACTKEQDLNSRVKDLDADKNIVQISQENGYLIDSYNVTTSDGYILTLFRISGGNKSPARKGKPAVLLLHGWGNSCEAWIALPNNKNIVYMLADGGWDVWLGNFRGSSFSLLHKTLNANKDLKYWDFTFHEMGLFDFPPMLDQVRTISGLDKIFVIGHSQGVSSFMVAASELPGINEKIHAAFLLAPVVYIGGAYDTFVPPLLSIINTPGEDLLYRIVQGRIQLRNPRLLFSALRIEPHDICQSQVLKCGLCDLNALIPNVFNPSQMNYTNIPRIVSKLPDYGTIKSALHYGQIVRSCSFRYYDRGTRENIKRYGTKEPPSYNLKRVKTPIFLYYAEQDAWVTPPDIQRLARALPSDTLIDVVRVNDDTFNHLDFVVARDANVLVYKPLIQMMIKFNNRIKTGV